MQFDWSTFALQTVNFAILVWLLHRFLYKPVLRLVDAAPQRNRQAVRRRASGRGGGDRRRLAAIDDRARRHRRRTRGGIDRSGGAGGDSSPRRGAPRRSETPPLCSTERARRWPTSVPRFSPRRAARRLISAADIAGRLLADVPLKLRADAWIERIEQHLAELPAAERDALARQLPDGVSLTVVTAAALSADTAEAWRSRLGECAWRARRRRFRGRCRACRRRGAAFPHRHPALFVAKRACRDARRDRGRWQRWLTSLRHLARPQPAAYRRRRAGAAARADRPRRPDRRWRGDGHRAARHAAR